MDEDTDHSFVFLWKVIEILNHRQELPVFNSRRVRIRRVMAMDIYEHSENNFHFGFVRRDNFILLPTFFLLLSELVSNLEWKQRQVRFLYTDMEYYFLPR